MILLASSSIARRKLIKICKKNVLFGIPDIDEKRLSKEDIYEYLQRITYLKALGFIKSNTTVICADTVIVSGNEIFGKPKDRKDAFNMLSVLSGNKHFCFTGVGVISYNRYEFFIERAVVKMKKLSKNEIESYLDRKEYIDKAAGYAIQGYAASFMDIVKGDITTVIGLPMKRLCRII